MTILGSAIQVSPPKKVFQLDAHHIVLYGVLGLVSLGGLSVIHQWRMDLERAKITQAAQQEVIAAADKRMADREKEFNDAVKEINTLKSTPQTTTKEIVEHLPQLIALPEKVNVEPAHSPVTGELVPGKQDLVLTPANQNALNDKLVECKVCENEREKLRNDLVDQKTKTAAMTKERDDWRNTAKGGSLGRRIWNRTKAFMEDAIILEGARCVAGKKCP